MSLENRKAELSDIFPGQSCGCFGPGHPCLQHELWATPLSFQKIKNVAFKCYASLLHVRSKLRWETSWRTATKCFKISRNGPVTEVYPNREVLEMFGVLSKWRKWKVPTTNAKCANEHLTQAWEEQLWTKKAALKAGLHQQGLSYSKISTWSLTNLGLK